MGANSIMPSSLKPLALQGIQTLHGAYAEREVLRFAQDDARRVHSPIVWEGFGS